MSLANKSFSIFRGTILIYSVQIATTAVIARILGPRDMGIWTILLFIPSYAEALFRLQLDEASVLSLGRKRYRLGETTFTLLVVSAMTGLVAILSFFLAREWLFDTFLNSLDGVRGLAFALVAYIPVNFVIVNTYFLCLSQEDPRGYNLVRFISQLLPSVFGALLLLTSEVELVGLVALQIAFGSLGAAVGLARIARIDRIRRPRDWAILRELWGFGYKLYFISVVLFLNMNVSGAVAALYLPPEDVGFLRLGLSRALLLALLTQAMGGILYPRISRMASEREASELTARSIRVGLLLLIALMGVAAVIGVPAFLVLYGHAFQAAIPLFYVVLPGVVVSSTAALTAHYFNGRGRPWLTFFTTLVPVIAQLGLLFWMVPELGVMGGALAACGAFFLAAFVQVGVFVKVSTASLGDVLKPRRADAQFLARFFRDKGRSGLRAAAARLGRSPVDPGT